MFSSCFMLFPTLKKIGNIEKCPFTYWLNGRWLLQIVDRDSGNLYPLYPLFPCSDFFISNVRVVGGGGIFFGSYFIDFQHFVKKNILGIKKYIYYFRKTILFHLMFSLWFFLC